MQMRRHIAISIALLGGLWAMPAGAEGVCGSRNDIMRHLQRTYSEAPVGMGLAANGAVLEILTSEQGSWTIMVTMPSGRTCVIATGDSWEDVKHIALNKPDV